MTASLLRTPSCATSWCSTPSTQQEAAFGADVLVRPAGVAIDRENRFLYVADTGNDVVDVFDADSYKLLRQIGKPSRKHDQTDPGTFSLPEGVAVDKDGNVYVTDTFNDRVEIFDADGEFISTFGKNGDGPADFERPKGIAVDCDGHIWVVDAAQNLVKVFNQQGRLLIYFGGQGNYPGQFMGPWGIAIGPSNQVIVSETFPGRVQVFRYVTDARGRRREGAPGSRTAESGGNAGFQPARFERYETCRSGAGAEATGAPGARSQGGSGGQEGFCGAIALRVGPSGAGPVKKIPRRIALPQVSAIVGIAKNAAPG